MATPAKPMPTPGSAKAPFFDGDPRNLEIFLDNYNRCIEAAQADFKKRIRWLPSFIEESLRDAVRQYAEYVAAGLPTTNTDQPEWDAFVERLGEDFSLPEEVKRYTEKDLEDLHTRWAGKVTTRDALMLFNREYRKISGTLAARKVIAVKKADDEYYATISKSLGSEFQLRVVIDYTAAATVAEKDAIMTRGEIFTRAAAFLAEPPRKLLSSMILDQTSQPPRQNSGKNKESTPVVKREPDLAAYILKLEKEKEDLQAQLRTQAGKPLLRDLPPHMGTSSGGEAGRDNTIPHGCFNCGGEDHYSRNCPELKELAQQGLCSYDIAARAWTWPSGKRIRSAQGKTLAETIRDSSAASKAAANATAAQVNLVTAFWRKPVAVVNQAKASATIEEVSEEYDWDDFVEGRATNFAIDTYAVTRAKERGGGAAAPVEEEVAAPPKRAPRPAPTQAAADPKPATATKERAEPAQGSSGAKQGKENPTTPFNALGDNTNQGKGYRNVAPAENEKTLANVFELAKKAVIPLSLEQLLSVSTELRAQFKSFVSAKRVHFTIGEVGSVQETRGPDGVDDKTITIPRVFLTRQPRWNDAIGSWVSESILPIKAIKAEMAGRPVRAILDSGSVVNCMHERVWERLDASLYPSGGIDIEVADGRIAKTQGEIRDYPFTINGVVFYVSFQVMHEANYAVLLGMPFVALTRAVMEFNTEGECVVSLRDPNAPETQFRVPTTNYTPVCDHRTPRVARNVDFH
jgi:gag-polyprotein putative aspartyl protease/Zinc knuckle